MNSLRLQAIHALDSYLNNWDESLATGALDALLDWLTANAGQIAESTFATPTAEDTERGRPHVVTVETEIHVLVAVLRGDA